MYLKKKLPLITIITVVYNGEEYIEKTIQSIINQTYTNFEFIVIDGGSTDNTLNIIKKYENKISYFISEPDKGIFDAMNKGLQKANGEWVNFMNSGDMFYDFNVLKSVFCFDYNDFDMIYGDVNLFDDKDSYFVKSKTNKIKINLNAICHQSVFIKTKMHPAFSLNYKLSADHQIIYGFIKNKKVKYLNIFISKILIGGVSSNLKDTRKEKFKITLNNGNHIDILLSFFLYLYGMIKDYSKKIILKFLPINFFYFLRGFKNKIEQS
ncbi:glycosyltransferase family 2 protein [uncultured Polaribacter sp.]|uniref:glycosyltransferase family 2 protein n=1 Tax=uncultured Polaribacter sp. TaxID=174711 RepID=UPI002635ED9F|nr:glycosyltransferase family 2 protein [uncultured Polaribacter sp.]